MKTRQKVASVLTAGICLVSVACGSSGTSSAADSTTTVASASTTTAVGVAGAELVGRYAHYDVVAYESADMKTLIVSYGFTDLDERDGNLEATESFCHAEHRSDLPIKVTMPDAATQAIIPESKVVDVSTVDGKLKLHRGETPTGIGIKFDDPANDVLPTDPNDPRITDSDNDGKPGITVQIEVSPELKGELYIARRERFAYNLSPDADGRLVGQVEDHSEQLVVGATNAAFKSTAEWVQYPDLSKSPMVLVPVERDWDCDRLMTEAPSIFPAVPSVDW